MPTTVPPTTIPPGEWWQPDSFHITAGSVVSGNVSYTYIDDSNRHILAEIASTPGFDYEYWFENIPSDLVTFRFDLNGYYSGDIGNIIRAYAWNYTLSSWAFLGLLVSRASDKDYIFPVIPASDYVSGNQAKIRFVHEDSGTVGHQLLIDMINIENMGVDITTAGPTTVPPTTTAPTTSAPTTAPPTTVPPSTLVPTTTIPTTPPPHVAANDTIFNCLAGNYAGVPIVQVSINGEVLSASAEGHLTINVSIHGEVPGYNLISDGSLRIEVSIGGWGIANADHSNWVAWSKIGEVSMVLDRVNDAGRIPMSWAGYVYQVKKLGKNVVIYGSGGVTLAHPVSRPAPTFGFKEILPIGIKNKMAVGGDEFVHFFIDDEGCLYSLAVSESITGVQPDLKRLGYEEYLVDLVNPILSWDANKRRLYISDATSGYIYYEQSMTGGYANLTGLYRVKNNLTGVSPNTIVTELVEVWTDILDFEHSGLKSIESIQFNSTAEIPIYSAIRYRYKKDEDFEQTDWSIINDQGISHKRVAGTEFKIGIRGDDLGEFDLSYFKVQIKYIDQRFTRDPRGPLKEY